MIKYKFNDNWEFEKADSNSRLAAFLGKTQKTIVHLPHDAMIHEERTPDTANGAQTGFYPGGEYIYLKMLDVPEEWKNKKVLLEFEGVYQIAYVYINGALVKKNVYGYSNFYIHLNPWLNFGKSNVIKVVADNSQEPNSRWYTGSGIYRNVNLLVGEKIHLKEEGIRITTLSANKNSAVVEIETQIENIEKEKKTVTQIVQLLYEGQIVNSDVQTVVMYPETTEKARHRICVLNPALWDCEHPELYQCRVILKSGNEIFEEYEENFGIRTLMLDVVHGLQINGKEVKLRGACIHHDNGILGAATFEKAEERRCRQLKEAGFNSIRSSHHPISKAMLDACDQYGILVMDEVTDVWTLRKNQYDFSAHFEECWEEVVERMVAKDYNHPSVIMYSVGNEISEAGSENGSRINRHMCNKIHALDATRYTTNGLNGLMAAGYRLKDIMTEIAMKFGGLGNGSGGNSDGSNGFNSFMSLMTGERGEYFAKHPLLTEALEGCSSSCDVIGLNYLTGRHELEHELHPNKTVVGTETYPAEIVRLWSIVKRNPHVLGDFTWAGYDYLGEAGCGIFHYDGNANFTSVYPERTAYIGDIDLIGYRRPISYLREIVYGLRKEPYIAVNRIDKYGEPCSKTPWMYKDNIESWTWNGCEGKVTNVDVYSNAEEVELFLNNCSLGRKDVGEENDFTASYEVVYEPGTLYAVSYVGEKTTGTFAISTANKEVELSISTDKTALKADGEDLAFLTVKLVDRDGIENLWTGKKVHVTVEGAGRLEAFGNANPSSVGNYNTNTYDTYEGYVMAVVRAGITKGKMSVTFSAEGCKEKCIEINVV